MSENGTDDETGEEAGADTGDGKGEETDDVTDSAPGRVANTGFDEWLDALATGEGYFLACPEGHGSLPPRRVCPECGATELREEPLPAVGAVETFTVVHVAPPAFADAAPYVTAVAGFGPVRLTGVLRGVEPDDDAVDVGLEVEVGVADRESDGERIVVLRPA